MRSRHEQLWTVVRFPSGDWSTGGKPTDPEYAECEVFQVMARNRDEAKRRGQAKRSRQRRKERDNEAD